MGFKPKGAQYKGNSESFVQVTYPTLEGGDGATENFFGRVSVIYYVGTQAATQLNDKGYMPKPSEQVVVAADLPEWEHQYVEDGDPQQVRITVKGDWNGMPKAFSCAVRSQKDVNNQSIKGLDWTLPGNSTLAKLAGTLQVPSFLDTKSKDHVELCVLLNQPLCIDLENKANRAGDKIYMNVAKDGLSKIRKNDKVPEITAVPYVIGLEGISDKDENDFELTEEIVAKINYGTKRVFMLAKEYEGSKMQELLKAEGTDDGSKDYFVDTHEEWKAQEEASGGEEVQRTPESAKPKQRPVVDDFDEDTPF